jgi:nucleoside 2-deoxyribosyltransferase
MKVYLAHPISGQTFEEVFNYYDKARKELGEFFEILSPMTGKGEFRNNPIEKAKPAGQNSTNPVCSNHAIKERDKWMVTQSDIVFLDLTGATAISIGCMMELAWADLLGKHTVVVINDLHNHAFVLECADIIFSSYEEAVDYLRNFKI